MYNPVAIYDIMIFSSEYLRTWAWPQISSIPEINTPKSIYILEIVTMNVNYVSKYFIKCSWRDLVLLEIRPVHWKHYAWKFYHCKLWLIVFYFLVSNISLSWFLLSLFKSHIQIVISDFNGLLCSFFSVHACVIMGDFCYFTE